MARQSDGSTLSTVKIPPGTSQIVVAPQIYGPGTVWFDDLTVEYTDAPAIDPTAR